MVVMGFWWASWAWGVAEVGGIGQDGRHSLRLFQDFKSLQESLSKHAQEVVV